MMPLKRSSILVLQMLAFEQNLLEVCKSTFLEDLILQLFPAMEEC